MRCATANGKLEMMVERQHDSQRRRSKGRRGHGRCWLYGEGRGAVEAASGWVPSRPTERRAQLSQNDPTWMGRIVPTGRDALVPSFESAVVPCIMNNFKVVHNVPSHLPPYPLEHDSEVLFTNNNHGGKSKPLRCHRTASHSELQHGLTLDQYNQLSLAEKAEVDQACLQHAITRATNDVVSFCRDYEYAFRDQRYFRDHGENSKVPSELGLTDRFLINVAAHFKHPKPGKLMMVCAFDVEKLCFCV